MSDDPWAGDDYYRMGGRDEIANLFELIRDIGPDMALRAYAEGAAGDPNVDAYIEKYHPDYLPTYEGLKERKAKRTRA